MTKYTIERVNVFTYTPTNCYKYIYYAVYFTCNAYIITQAKEKGKEREREKEGE